LEGELADYSKADTLEMLDSAGVEDVGTHLVCACDDSDSAVRHCESSCVSLLLDGRTER
jgi:hypothetical protein